MKILLVSSDIRSIQRFRMPLIQSLKSKGHTVCVAAPSADFPISFDNQSKNIRKNLKTLYELFCCMKNYQPHVVLSYHLKPTLYTGLCSLYFPALRHIPTLTGLGYLKKASFLHPLYRLAMKRAFKIFIQNQEDLLWMNHHIYDNSSLYQHVAGSGIDLQEFSFAPLPQTALSFLFVGRFLKSKGIQMYIAACSQIKKHYPFVKASVIGQSDHHPEGINEDEIKHLCHLNAINYIGFVEDVRPYLNAHHIFVLPSFYPEGVPRAGIEALAIGRPILTTDHPGCKDLVNGQNGYLITSEKELCEAMEKMVTSPLEKMAASSRRLAEERFDVHTINEIYRKHIEM